MNSEFKSPEIEFRLATNLGACALDLGELQAAKDEFDRALASQPDNPKALANAAIGATLVKDYDTAIALCKKAKLLKQSDSHATSILIQVLHKAKRKDELGQLIEQEEWMLSDSSCLLALGMMKLQDGEYKKAESYARSCLEQTTKEEGVYKLLGDAIIIPIQKKFQKSPPLKFRIDHATKNRIEEAQSHYTSAIDILKDSEKQQKLHDVFINRALVRGFLGYAKEAIEDCDKVLSEDNTNHSALFNKGIFNFELNEHGEAVSCFEKLPDHNSKLSIAVPLAQAYIASNNHQKALNLLFPHWNPINKDPEQLTIANLLLNSFSSLGKVKEINDLTEKIGENWPDQPEALIGLAYQKKREGDFDGCISLLSRADQIHEGKNDLVTLEIADAHYENNSFDQAAKHYEIIVDETTPNSVLNKYCISLYNSGNQRKAFNLAKKIRGTGPPLPTIGEIEATVLEFIGNYKEARNLYFDLSKIDPSQPNYRVNVCRLAILEGNQNAALEAIQTLHYDEISNDPMALIEVAKFRTHLDLDDVLPFAYQARRNALNDPEIHLSYIGVFHRRHKRDNALLDPQTIEINCTVQLNEVEIDSNGNVVAVQNGKKNAFTILNNNYETLQNGEIAESDPLATLLLGHKKGDVIDLKKSSLEDLKFEIIEIQSKYVFAFQRSLSEFSTRFPTHPGLHEVRVVNNDFSKIFSAIDKRQTFVTQAMDLYKTRQLTLGGLSKMIGVPLIDIWAGLVTRTDGRLFSCLGNDEEKQYQANNLQHKPRLVLDLTALLTLGSLSCLDRLLDISSEITVTQSVFDEINKELMDDFGDTSPSMQVWKEGDQYVRQEITAESLEKRRHFLTQIHDFLKQKANLVPASSGLTIELEAYKELNSVLGRSSIDSILTAKEKGCLLYSDDLFLREIAKNEWQVDGVWSQPILAKLCNEQKITDELYHESISKLVLGNYHFVSVDADALLFIFKKNDWTPTYDVIKVFSNLHGPVCSDASAVRVLSEFLKKAWLEALIDRHKLWALDLSLEALTAGRFGTKIIKQFIAVLEGQFSLMPLDWEIIMDQIKLKLASPNIIRT